MAEDRRDDRLTDRMLQYRTVALGGKITDESSAQLLDQLLQLQLDSTNEPIHLFINSGGGRNSSALFLHDVIAHVLSAPVHGLVTGQCSSAATFVLLACPVRRCTPHARFVIHSGTMGDISIQMNNTSLMKIERLAQEVRKDTEWAIQFYMNKLRLPRKKVQELIARGDEDFDNELTAEEAREIGLITEIISTKAGVFPLAG